MILTRTPLRISFVGGGSDLPTFCQGDDGAVVSMAISKFIYVAVNEKFDDRVRVSYSITEDVKHASELRHDLVRNALIHFGKKTGIEVVSIADIPGKGTGLGSSSSFVVGLVNALHTYGQNNEMTRAQLAKTAAHIEMDLCGKPIGKQDHFAAAMGGLNLMRFSKGGKVSVEPIPVDLKTYIELNSRLMLFYTGRSRPSKNILEDQQSGIFVSEQKRQTTRDMVKIAEKMVDDLGNNNLNNFGDYLLANWVLKKELSDKISDSQIDMLINAGLDAGASGAKICGAGGGGFILFYALEEKQPFIRSTMSSLGLKEMPFSAHTQGSEIVYG